VIRLKVCTVRDGEEEDVGQERIPSEDGHENKATVQQHDRVGYEPILFCKLQL
jgi:hypothetical protein